MLLAVALLVAWPFVVLLVGSALALALRRWDSRRWARDVCRRILEEQGALRLGAP